MRPITVGLAVCTVLVALDALAQGPPTVEVEVTNFPDPQNVVVTNEVPVVVVDLPRFQLVGFSAATRPANTGLFPLSQACSSEFEGSRICMSEEVIETAAIPMGLE